MAGSRNKRGQGRTATDTMIDKFAPVDYGLATFQATKMPVADKMVIRVFGSRQTMYDTDGVYGKRRAVSKASASRRSTTGASTSDAAPSALPVMDK